MVEVAFSAGRIKSVSASGAERPEVESLDGRLLLPAMAEPHAHLDKALTADLIANPAGNLLGAIEAVHAAWPAVSAEEIVNRATTAARKLVAAGATAIRTHADVGEHTGLKSIEALACVKAMLTGVCDIEIVALAHPLTGPGSTSIRVLLERAMAAGADLVGGAPHLDSDPAGSISFALGLAKESGVGVDLHLDEVLDSTVENLPELARRVVELGLEGRVTASHCVSHGLQTAARQREVARMLATAGVSVVTNPRTNLYLQGRGVEQAPARGLAGVRAMIEQGVTVAAGADNLQDPFYVIGRSDPLETAALLVSAAHLAVDEAWALISTNARRLMARESVTVSPGSPAELVAIRAASVREAIADQTEDRVVIHRGRVVARTTVDRWVEPARPI